MTREEAIVQCEVLRECYRVDHSDRHVEALNMAIEALKQPCADAVSREAALEAMRNLPHEYKTKEQRARTGGIAACQMIVEDLPSVQPERADGILVKEMKIMKLRTEGEMKAYAEGYNACFKAFCGYLTGKYTIRGAIEMMKIIVEAVSRTVTTAESEEE